MTCGVESATIERIFTGFATHAQKQIPSSLQRSKRKVIVIAGPTACGKSEIALPLCQQIGGEIISADSMQVYRGMDLGTAKPSKEELQLVPHHLVNIKDVREKLNVVDYYYEARHACQTVLSHENIPVIVGGSGFYLHTLLYGPPSGPPPVPELRKSLEEEMAKIGPDAMFERLAQLDLEYSRTITKHDKQKIVRALEIITLTGKKVSKLSWKGRHKPMNYDFRCWFFHRPREVIYHRIAKRCDKMIESGFLEEVEALMKSGLLENTSACQAIGYRQAIEYIQGEKTKKDYIAFIESFKQASRHYAKRQFTWFKNEPLFRWIDLDMHDPEVVIDIIEQDYESAL